MKKKEKPKLLWVSLMAPYDEVKHASGRIQNYFLKNLFKRNEFDIHVITFEIKENSNEIDLDKYGISNTIFLYTWAGLYGKLMKLLNFYGKINIWGKAAGLVSPYYKKHCLKEMKRLKSSGYIPDLVILDWTEIATMLDEVKKIFNSAKIIIIEEDVSFLGHKRKANSTQGIRNLFLKLKSKKIETMELDLLNKANLIILNNYKDKKLIQDKIKDKSKIWIWCPYYQSMIDRPYKRDNKDILFYGAISRKENWKSIVWFIEYVWNRIEDTEVRLVILGSNPPDIIKKYESDRIVITGFVEEIWPYFSSSLCLVAPLVLGAGVKIKVIEGLSSGIPVLTNSIGIEGIPAVSKRDYFFCEKPDDYIFIINELLNYRLDVNEIERNSKKFIRNYFNFEKDIEGFENELLNLLR